MGDQAKRIFELEVDGFRLGFTIAQNQPKDVIQTNIDTLINMKPSLLVSLLSMSSVVFISIDDIPYSHFAALEAKKKVRGRYPNRLVHIELLGVRLVAGLFDAESKPTDIDGGWLKMKTAFMQRRLCNIPLNEANEYLSRQSLKISSINDYRQRSKELHSLRSV
ncbi:hypothetical protein [Vibrio harveyi]